MSLPTRENEVELVKAAKRGDRKAFDALVDLHAPRLLAIAIRMAGNKADAQDAVQNALASAWLALPKFDLSRSISPWLTTIVINKCRDLARSRRFSRLFRSSDDFEELNIADEQPDQQRHAQGRQLLEQVQLQISRLPSRLKEPFVLVVFDGLSQAEAAQILGVTEKTVETRIYRARKRIRQKVDLD